jgi:ribosomal protein S27E
MTCDDCIHKSVCYRIESVSTSYADKCGDFGSEKTGHWIREKERHFLDTRTNENVEMKEATGKGYHTYINVQCSKCRKITIHDDSILYQYCPHCGAKMESEE